MSRLEGFAKTARGLARNPLGIIALFIVLIYGFASLVVGLSGQLGTTERMMLVGFLVAFPMMVLGGFAWLVSRHHTKMYAPADYRADESFLRVSERRAQVAAGLSAAAARQLASRPSEQVLPVDSKSVAVIAERAVTSNTIRVLSTVRRTKMKRSD